MSVQDHWLQGVLGLFWLAFIACQSSAPSKSDGRAAHVASSVSVQILGIAQDAGYPQIGCRKACCAAIELGIAEKRRVSCLGIVDRMDSLAWLIDATPDITEQWQQLRDTFQWPFTAPHGILLTHAHMGHYTGLMYLGREALGGKRISVYAAQRMQYFLASNGPWDQLVRLQNIRLHRLTPDSIIDLSDQVRIRPFEVPHRDEYSETLAFEIIGPDRRVLYIPDIDKWAKWTGDLSALIQQVDVALIDGTFLKGDELPGRDISEVPHPFIVETIAHLEDLPQVHRAKVRFIHLNHTNPALYDASARQWIRDHGFDIATEGALIPL